MRFEVLHEWRLLASKAQVACSKVALVNVEMLNGVKG